MQVGLWRQGLVCLMVLCVAAAGTSGYAQETAADNYGHWMAGAESAWPQIALVNQIEYTDKRHPIAGCGFLLDTGEEILAATAKHILIFFRSDSMTTVSFGNRLKNWRMFPKNQPGDLVVVDRLLNEDPGEPLEGIPSSVDWLLFTVDERSPDIQPLRLRTDSLRPGEPLYIVGWRYSDKDCPQVIYAGHFVRADSGSLLIATEELADNTMPGLSGAPVIDARGYVVGLMSQKAGKLERLSSLDYPRALLEGRYGGDR